MIGLFPLTVLLATIVKLQINEDFTSESYQASVPMSNLGIYNPQDAIVVNIQSTGSWCFNLNSTQSGGSNEICGSGSGIYWVTIPELSIDWNIVKNQLWNIYTSGTLTILDVTTATQCSPSCKT